MPPRQRKRTDRHTNVFVQETAPKGREEMEESGVDIPVEDDAVAVAGTSQMASAARARKLRAQRVARQTRARSEIFTRTLGKELRKLGVLMGCMAVILVVLTFVL